MTPLVFILVALSASLHVLWNALVKTSENKASFAWATSVAGFIVLVPLFLISRVVAPGPINWHVVGWAALSGLFEALYVACLFNAYRRADLSVVYPLSRGVAPVVTMLLGGALVGDQVSWPGAMAVAVVVFGIIGVSFSSRDYSRGIVHVDKSGLLLAAGTGCMIAGYHLVDRQAMLMDAAPNPLEYLSCMHLFLACYVTLWAYSIRKRGRDIAREWKQHRKAVATVGICTPAAYLLIMIALKYGNVTYIAAGRNIGIFISTIIGWGVFKERMGAMRLGGAVLIGLGVVSLVVLIPHS